MDGIFSVLGIIAAAGAASLSTLQMFTTGLGGAAAGALSVFAATYMSETTEKKARLLEAWENSKTSRRSGNGNGQRRVPSKREHVRFHRLLAKVNRRAILSGFITSSTSAFFSLALLLPLLVFSQIYSPNASILIGVILLSMMGAFRGVALRQSAAKSAVKMVILGILIVLVGRLLGSYVQALILRQ